MTNTTGCSGISSLRANLRSAPLVTQREGLTSPPVAAMVRRWAATAALIVLLTVFRSLSLCVAAILGVAAFLESRPIATWIRDLRRG